MVAVVAHAVVAAQVEAQDVQVHRRPRLVLTAQRHPPLRTLTGSRLVEPVKVRRAETITGVPGGTRVVSRGLHMASEGQGQVSRRPVGRGRLVEWEGITCRVVQRRRVSALAVPRVSEFELYLEPADGSGPVGWVPEPEVSPTAGDEGAA